MRKITQAAGKVRLPPGSEPIEDAKLGVWAKVHALRCTKPGRKKGTWLFDFVDQLVRPGDHYEELHRKLVLTLLGPQDRAHDHRKGMSIYWKMPFCGFQFPLTLFQRNVLKLLKIPPSQLTSTAWCVVSSFECFMNECSKLLKGPKIYLTVGLLLQFYKVQVSDDYITHKKRTDFTDGRKNDIFLPDSAMSKIDGWNFGWAYLANYADIERNFEDGSIPCKWRNLDKDKLIAPKPESFVASDIQGADRIREFISNS